MGASVGGRHLQPVELLKSWVSRQAGDQAAWFAESITKLNQGSVERDLHIVLGYAPRRLGKAELALRA